MLAEEIFLNKSFGRFAINSSPLDVGLTEFLLQVSGVVQHFYLLTRPLFICKVSEAMLITNHIIRCLSELVLVEALDIHFTYFIFLAVVKVNLVVVCVLELLLGILNVGFLAHKLDKVGLA